MKKNKLTLAGDYSCNSARVNYSYSEDTLNNIIHSQEFSNSNVETRSEISKETSLLLGLAPGFKSGLERFLAKYPNWRF